MTTRAGERVQRWYCSDCDCEHEASVIGGVVVRSESKIDESLYEDDSDHEGHWFEIWGED